MNFLGKELIPYKSISIVAEISCNHEGSLKQAFDLIEAAKDSGADAVKIQAYTPEEMTINSNKVDFICPNGPWAGKNLWELYNKTRTPLEWLPELFAKAEQLNIPMFSSVFGEKSLAALEAVNCPVYKIASFEISDVELLKMVAAKHKPMILSLGVATNDDIERAVGVCENDCYIQLMHCVSEYPAKLSNINLYRIRSTYYGVDGFSDHTLNSKAAQLAIAMGITIIEKHICMTETCEDVSFSLKPYEFKSYVRDCYNTIEAFKERTLELTSLAYKRSLYIVENIKKGEVFTNENIKAIRPGFGLGPYLLPEILGKTANYDLETGTPLRKEHIS